MSGPLDALLLVSHIAAVVVSYGAIGMTGAYARACRTAADPFAQERLRAFFRPGPNIGARVLFVVPLLGFGLLATEPSADFSRAYPWIGLAIWILSVTVATATLWPAESEIQLQLLAGDSSESRRALRAACRTVERAAASLSVLFVIAVVVMVARL